MAKCSCIYTALVFKRIENQLTSSYEEVDLFDLSDIDYEKIIINQDVYLGNSKGNELPDFTNIEINGELDCSNFTLRNTSVLPKGITSLKCFYSFNNLEVLKDILPKTVKTVHVRNSIINSVKKEADALRISQDFIKTHPSVKVIGKTETLILNEVIKNVTEPKENKESKRTNKRGNEPIEHSATITKNSSKKGYLSIPEAATELKKIAEYKDINIKEIKKRLKTFLYNNRQDDRWGNIQNYVPESALSELSEALLNQEDQDSVQKEPVVKELKITKKKPEKDSIKNQKEELKPVKIRKFFDKSVLNFVFKVCKDNKKLLLKFLNTINDINLPASQIRPRVNAGRVACIKNNELKLIPNLEFKGSWYIAQGFGRDNNRPRVIWCILSNGDLVASESFANHGDGKNKCSYNAAILSSVLKEKTEQNFNKDPQSYIDINSLLYDLKHEKKKKIPAQQIETPENDYPSLTEKEPETIKPVSISEAEELSAPTKDITTTSTKEEINFETSTTENVQEKDIPKENKKEKSDDVLFQISYELKDVFNIINNEILLIKQELISETNTEKSIILTNKLFNKLREKQLLEQNLEVTQKAFDILKQYIALKKGKVY